MSNPSPMGGSPQSPQSATISSGEIAALKTSWQKDVNDLGLVLYEPTTGDIHVGSFDDHGGHDLFLQNLGGTDRTKWRGAIVTSSGQVVNNSGLNVGLGFGQAMPPDEWSAVLEALRNAGLTTQTL